MCLDGGHVNLCHHNQSASVKVLASGVLTCYHPIEQSHWLINKPAILFIS